MATRDSMNEVKESQDVYLSDFAVLEKKLATGGVSWLHQIRKAALERFAVLGFPTTRQEAWRFTNVAPIVSTRWEPVRPRPADSLAEKLKRLPYAELECSRLVFVNGVLAYDRAQEEKSEEEQ